MRLLVAATHGLFNSARVMLFGHPCSLPQDMVFCDTLLTAHDGGDLRNACTSSHVSVYTAVSLPRCRVDSRVVTIDGR